MKPKIAPLIILAVVAALSSVLCLAGSAQRLPADTSLTSTSEDPPVVCFPLGLHGTITSNILVERLTEGGEELVFLGTSSGLYVIAPGGHLSHFLYTPFGVSRVLTVDDINGDAVRDVVVVLNDTFVPALRCYSGATWQELWQFAPLETVYATDTAWTERQPRISDVAVFRPGDSQAIVITANRSAFAVNATDGQELWRFDAGHTLGPIAVVGDLDEDSAEEIVVAPGGEQVRPAEAALYLIGGKTGRLMWEHRPPRHTCNSYSYDPQINDIAALDPTSGRIIMVASDGKLRLIDLPGKTYVWETTVIECGDGIGTLGVTIAPDISGDGLPEVLVFSPWAMNSPVVLVDSTGETIWSEEMSNSGVTGVSAGTLDNRPVILEPAIGEIRIIDLASGDLIQAIQTASAYVPMVREYGEGSYLLVSDSNDLNVINAFGERLWDYRRVSSVRAQSADLNGDGQPEVLFRGQSYQPTAGQYPSQMETTRLLQVMDTTTGTAIWTYEFPCDEPTISGGLSGISIVPDIAGGDGLPDIIAYRGSDVFVFRGSDGSRSVFSAGEQVASLATILNGTAGHAIAAVLEDGLALFRPDGAELWRSWTADWGLDTGYFNVLDDVNSDGVSDLAIFSQTEILVLRSIDAIPNYEIHLSIPFEEGKGITNFDSLAPDVDGDGVRELVYLLYPSYNEGQQYTSACPKLHLQSPVSGEILLKIETDHNPTCVLSCADFDADGWADSVVYKTPWSSCKPPTYDAMPPAGLQIVSGRDGNVLWEYSLGAFTNYYDSYGYYVYEGGSPYNVTDRLGLPVTSVGDMNNDGYADLLLVREERDEALGQLLLEVHDVMHNERLKEIPVSPWLHSSYAAGLSSPRMLKCGDINGDGVEEVILNTYQPMASTSAYPGYMEWRTTMSSHNCLALVDISGGKLMASFWLTDPSPVDTFPTGQPGVLGLTANGAACYLNTNVNLEITSPSPGSTTNPSFTISWNSTSLTEYAQVFVDGIRNRTTHGLEADLIVKPGQHNIAVLSVDDWGRMSSASLSIQTSDSVLRILLPLVTALALLVLLPLFFYARLHRMRRLRRHEKVLLNQDEDARGR